LIALPKTDGFSGFGVFLFFQTILVEEIKRKGGNEGEKKNENRKKKGKGSDTTFFWEGSPPLSLLLLKRGEGFNEEREGGPFEVGDLVRGPFDVGDL
jgi:hypothetical protein